MFFLCEHNSNDGDFVTWRSYVVSVMIKLNSHVSHALRIEPKPITTTSHLYRATKYSDSRNPRSLPPQSRSPGSPVQKKKPFNPLLSHDLIDPDFPLFSTPHPSSDSPQYTTPKPPPTSPPFRYPRRSTPYASAPSLPNRERTTNSAGNSASPGLQA